MLSTSSKLKPAEPLNQRMQRYTYPVHDDETGQLRSTLHRQRFSSETLAKLDDPTVTTPEAATPFDGEKSPETWLVIMQPRRRENPGWFRPA